MSISIFLSVIAAGLLHACWNAIIKFGSNKVTAMLLLTLVQAAIGVIVALGRDFPQGQVWFWLIGSGIFHSFYKLFLAYAYEQGDLSRVYPIARGAAPMLVMLVGALILSDVMNIMQYSGIILLGLGILLMARGAFTSNESRRLVPLAIGSAMATAGYTIIDGMGARVGGDAVTYVAWLFIFDALLFTPVVVLLHGTSVLRASPKDWMFGSIAATGSYSAYAISVWAMTKAPIALVAALRETSILFAVLIGWLFFGDKFDKTKIFAVLLIVAGVMVTRL